MMKLSKEFLIDFYSTLQEVNQKHIFVAMDNGKVVGFVVGYSDTKRVSQILKKNMIKTAWRIITKRYKISLGLFELVKDGYKNYRYMSRPQGGGELLSIAVHNDYQGKGIGSILFKHFEKSLTGIIPEYYIFTHSNLTKTLQYYLKLGCEEIGRVRDGSIVIFKKVVL